MALRFDSRDATAFKFLFFLAAVYGVMSILAYYAIHSKFVKPLDFDAPLDRFSEARAVEHVRVLSQEIDGRQEGRPGLSQAAKYIKSQLEMIKERAKGSNLRIEIEETVVDGSFNMMFLAHSISLGYRNHTNIAMRISSTSSKENDPSVLVNGHFDSPLGSPGAGDCGSCVAAMLEVARLTVDSGWVPPRPIILLFNGAEELFLLGAHGFMKTNKWRDTVGASINIEASGVGGLDLVCQSGPSSWPSRVYAQSAIYPMGNSAAQDVFPVIPGDTDYRVFSQDYGNIPGLDIIFLVGGVYYHTSYDTVDRLLPGSLQQRGENLCSLLKAFSNSSELRSAQERESLEANPSGNNDEHDVFFDFLTFFMISYSRNTSMILHRIPIVIFIAVPFFLRFLNPGLRSSFATTYDFVKGTLLHATGVVLAIIVPVSFSIIRLLFSSYTMNWFAHPYLAFMIFIPCSLAGLLIPRVVWKCFPLSQDATILRTSKEALSTEAWFWGAFGYYALFTTAYLVFKLHGGFLTFMLTAAMLPAWIFYCLSVKLYGHQSLRATISYMVPLIPCVTYAVYFGGFLALFLIEKMSMMGSAPPPYGLYVQDTAVAGIIGLVIGWCVGPLMPVCGNWLARSSVLQFLLHLGVLSLALSSQFFPYSTAAPKRIVFQHSFITTDATHVKDSSYEFAVVDSNSLKFVFKQAPEVAKQLNIGSEFSVENALMSKPEDWLALFPVSFLFTRSLKFPAKSDEVLKNYEFLPYLSNYKPHTTSGDGYRKVHLDLSLGSLQEVWVAVLNITGPLSSWSFADNKLPAPESINGGPPSYILRLSGSSSENWKFWLEANSSDNLRVDVAVLDQVLVDEAKKLKSLFPDWIDVVAYSSFLSSYLF